MEIRDLEVFVTVATELHFARSAERLHMSPATVSAIIRALERDIGAELLTRTSRSVKLTEAGTDFLVEARNVLAAADRAKAAVQPRLRIAVTEFPIWAELAKAAIDALDEPWRHRCIPVALPWVVNRAAVEAGDLDAGFTYFMADQALPAALAGIKLGDAGLAGALVAPDHPLAHRGTVHISELRDQPMGFIAREHNPDFFDAMMAAMAQDGFVPRLRVLPSALNTNIVQNMTSAMDAQGGWTACPNFLTRNPPPGTVGLKLEGLPHCRGQLWMIWRPTLDRQSQRRLTAAVKQIADQFDLDRA